jgi:hypothetical protein
VSQHQKESIVSKEQTQKYSHNSHFDEFYWQIRESKNIWDELMAPHEPELWTVVMYG